MHTHSPLAASFILHFGEMGSRWGVNRTVGQIYALLFISNRPMHADEIAETLTMSRSNVGLGLKELQAWKLTRLQHLPGDRRDYYSAPQDVWEIFRILVEERRQREVEPTLTLLRDSLQQEVGSEIDRVAQQRMHEMYNMMQLLMDWLTDIQKLSPETLKRLLRLGGKVAKLLDFVDRMGESRKETPAATPDEPPKG
ncbi:DNA-binding transcriptional regulator GbsR (MarR family) [Fluviicoccus keumensis]|uniref:HTH-type transcriptional regulator n=1 Tax=Fluviicoccus keumensis TaxID=1435465 RepID=A0A4Q7Z9J5_9GAMM|nr:GbsR/MarR family transcriptional regulator [Fluviicoccus keumensis]RZU46731.1 DNA-binding transcriptional regulator GbsR (MarR family) [Fluviicoccus keumensis]